jgi:hypothetical protein
MTTQLVQRGELETVVHGLIVKEREIAEQIEKLLPHVTVDAIRLGLERRLNQSLEAIRAMEAGYIPVDGGWFTKVDTKNKWRREQVKDVLDSMPEDAKEAWEKAKEMGVFNSFSISGGRGDPMIVGNAGKRHFLIACWANLVGGYSAGVRFMGKEKRG